MMFKNQIYQQIREINRLNRTKTEPFRKLKIKFLKNEILKQIEEDLEIAPIKVGYYVLVKAYSNGDIMKPYLQIFTKKTWKVHENWLKNNKNVFINTD